ncbi:MAG: C4-dicarboxylate TRAP transporter substrate-binding protein [Pseudomonadota bacterium]
MKKLMLVLLSLTVLVSAVSIAAAAEDKSIKLRFSTSFPPPTVSMVSYTAKLWMDEVTKRSNGQITFQPYWGGALGKPQEHLTLLQKGIADVVLTNAHFTPGKLPLGQFEYVFPFGPLDPVIVTKAKRKMFEEFPQFAADLAKYNAVQVYNASAAVYQILSKTPVRDLEEMKGKKISLIGRYFGRWFETIGAVPVVVPAAERYTMLQTGVLDMDLLPIDLFFAFKIYEQATNLVKVDALTGNFLDLWINANSLAKLPKPMQQLLLEVGQEVEMRVATEVVPTWSKRVMDDFKKRGITVIDFPAAERDKWAGMLPDIPAEWAQEVTEQGYPGWEIVKRYQDLTTEYGYKWPRKWGVKK